MINYSCEKTDYDKLQLIVVTLGRDGTNSTDQLIKYLSLILSDEKPLDERKRQLEDEYRIPMTYDIEEEMSSMCNMGEAIRRKAEAEGENRLGTLIAKLKELGRIDDAFKAAEDKQYREKLYKEFQLA